MQDQRAIYVAINSAQSYADYVRAYLALDGNVNVGRNIQWASQPSSIIRPSTPVLSPEVAYSLRSAATIAFSPLKPTRTARKRKLYDYNGISESDSNESVHTKSKKKVKTEDLSYEHSCEENQIMTGDKNQLRVNVKISDEEPVVKMKIPDIDDGPTGTAHIIQTHFLYDNL